jgi:hypothetical protein
MGITEDLNIFDLGRKLKENQQNYLEYILRIQTTRIPRKPFEYHPKGGTERGRP